MAVPVLVSRPPSVLDTTVNLKNSTRGQPRTAYWDHKPTVLGSETNDIGLQMVDKGHG